MKRTFNIILVEDSDIDAELIEIQLKKLSLNFNLEKKESGEQLIEFLETSPIDLIICDYNLPGLTGVDVLGRVREMNPDLPFILISGYLGEEKATDAMLKGASDYVMKDKLERLVPAVHRELLHYHEYQEAEKTLEDTRKRYESLVHTIEGIVWEADAETFRFLYVSPQTQRILGYPPSAWYESDTFWQDHIHPDDREDAVRFCHIKTLEGENHTFEYRMIDAGGEIVWFRDYVTVVTNNGHPNRLRGIMVDISDKKETEEERDHAISDLRERIKEQKCLYNISSLDEQKLTIPELLQKSVEYLRGGLQYPEIAAVSIQYAGDTYQTETYAETFNTLTAIYDGIDNSSLIVEAAYSENTAKVGVKPFLEEERRLINTVCDILGRKVNRILIQQELQDNRELLRKTYDIARIGNWEIDVIHSKVYWSDIVKDIHEVPKNYQPDLKTAIKFYKSGKDWGRLKKLFKKATDKGKPFEAELRIITANNNERWIHAVGEPELERGECVRLYGTIQDIDERKRAAEALQESEKRFKSLVQDGSDLIAILDSEGNYKYVSPTSQRESSLGLGPEGFKEKSCFDFIHENDRERVQRILSELKKNERREIEPYRFTNPDGKWRWLETTITNLTDTPAIQGYVTNSRDVTERIEQEKKLNNIVEYSTNLFYQHDANHVITYISPQCIDFLGCDAEEAKIRWTEFATEHPVNEKGFQKTLTAIATGEPQAPYELQLQKVSGEKIWVIVNEAPVVENGKTVAMVGSLTDITEQKKYEEQLEELSLVAAKTTDIIIMTDADGRITWVNNAFENRLGFSLEESTGKMPGILLRGANTDQVTAQKIQESKERRESIHQVILNYTKDGREIWLDMTADPIFDDDGRFKGYIAIDKDVTEQIKQKRKLQESVERYEAVIKATSDTIWDADLVNDVIRYNYNIQHVFGYNLEDVEASGSWWIMNVHPEDRDRVSREFELAELAKMNRIQTEYRFQSADGSYKHVHDRAFIILDDKGNPVRMIGAMQDITKQKEESQWLKLLESAITNTTESIAILEAVPTKQKGRKILYVNDAFEKMTGYSFDEAVGKTLYLLNGPKTSKKELNNVVTALDNWEPCHTEVINYKKSGEEFWAQVSFAPVKDSKGKYSHWICVGRDVTERRNRVNELRESLLEKETLLMEIHHRVKNNLAVVSSMMHLQAMEEKDESLQKKLYDSVVRIRTMVTIHELLYESRSFTKINFSENLKKLVTMIIETIQDGDKFQVEYRCDDIELNVNQAIPSSLIVNEVVTNVIKHAFTGRKKGKILLEVKESQNQVRMKIHDNGNGLPDDFEEKESSLGMQLIKVLAEQMNADYIYSNAPQGGTVFDIQFKRNTVKGIGNAYLT